MPLVIIDKREKGLMIERISTAQWRNLKTLQGWVEQNPKAWEQIKTFVYNRELHKKNPPPLKRSPNTRKTRKKKKKWFG